MKKRLIQLALILGLMTLTCVAAQATESAPTSGLKKFSIEGKYKTSVTLVALDAKGEVAKADTEDDTEGDTVYPGAAKVRLTYKDPQKDSEYLLIVLVDGEDNTPTVDNMAYIDQQTGNGSNLNFTIYTKKPDATAKSVTYSVYMSSSTAASTESGDGTSTGVTGYVKVGSFEYYSTGLNFTLGDVNNDEVIDVQDALMVLQHFALLKLLDETQFAAADVNKDNVVDVQDALKILQYFARLIPSID